MEQEIKVNANDIMEKLEKLQEDINFIKKNITAEISLHEELKIWEQASEDDIAEFNKKHNL
ncbi:MAG: hypothetical protein RL557_780 [archaeon]|jgi:hypothetical protein